MSSSDGPFESANQTQASEGARDIPPVLLNLREGHRGTLGVLGVEKVNNLTGIRSRDSWIHRAHWRRCEGGSSLRLRSRGCLGRSDSLRSGRRTAMSRNKQQETCSNGYDEKECKGDSQE